MIIMGRLTRGLGGQAGTHDDYYAINPRGVSGMVEKSKKKPFCDVKFDKKQVFLGDRVLEPQRERSIINDLRAPQATLDNEPNLGLEHDNLKPAFDISVDPTDARGRTTKLSYRRG